MILDLVIENARILTVDPDRPRASRLGVWDGRVVGSTRHWRAAGPG